MRPESHPPRGLDAQRGSAGLVVDRDGLVGVLGRRDVAGAVDVVAHYELPVSPPCFSDVQSPRFTVLLRLRMRASRCLLEAG